MNKKCTTRNEQQWYSNRMCFREREDSNRMCFREREDSNS